MPGSVSPPRGPRRRSPSPRRDRERDDRRDRPRDDDRRERRDDDRRDRDRRDDRGGDRERRSDRDRDERPRPRDSDREVNRDADRGPSSRDRRTPSPPRRSKPKTKELSFYKKSSSSMGSFSHRRDPLALDNIEESAKERMERRAMGEVPARFGGTREQGVRNTMSTIAPAGGSATRGGGDPLDRMPAKGGADGDRMMAERVAAMGGGAPAGGAAAAAAGPPSGIPTPRNSRMIEVIANDRMGRKVRVKCLPTDTVGDLKKLIAAQTGTTHQKIQLKKWYTVYKDHVSLRDYEINDGMSLEMY